MTTAEQKLILPHYIQDVKGRRPRKPGKIKIPNYEDLPQVRGIFRFIEMPGAIHSFTCRFWKGAPKTFHLADGQEYKIPRVVADHLNDDCGYKEMKWVAGDIISTAKPILVGGTSHSSPFEDATKEVKIVHHRTMFQILGDA